MANIVITTQPQSITVVPGKDTTFTVVGSADFNATYGYQWKLGGTPIAGATSNSYFIDPLMTNNGNVFSVSVSALSAGVSLASVNSNNATLTVQEDIPPFNVFDKGKETGRERHRRLRLLGYI
jgi:hypothetical protein